MAIDTATVIGAALVSVAKGEATRQVRAALVEALDRGNQDASRTFEQVKEDIIFESQGRLEAIEAQLGSVSKVLSGISSPEVARLLRNYAFEGAREVTEGRYRMLVEASASAVDPRVSIEAKARLERTLRELSPNDVMWLDRLNAISPAPGSADAGGTRHQALNRCPSGDELIAAGCVRVFGGGWGGGESASITDRGRIVLELLAHYIEPRRASFAADVERDGR